LINFNLEQKPKRKRNQQKEEPNKKVGKLQIKVFFALFCVVDASI